MPRPPRPALAALLAVPVVVAAGCTDQALVDRVAALEASQERLRASLDEVDAPDPDEAAAREQLTTRIESITTTIGELEGSVAGLRTDVDEGSLVADDRLTAVELQLEQLSADLSELTTTLQALTDRTSSLEVQLDAHRDQPAAHAGSDP